MVLGTLLDEETRPGNYVSRCLNVAEDYRPLVKLALAIAIGAVCEGDVAFFEDEWSGRFLDLLPFSDYHLEVLKRRAEERLNVGLFAIGEDNA